MSMLLTNCKRIRYNLHCVVYLHFPLQYMKTNKADVFGAGDVVEFPLWLADSEINIGHWQMAHAHGNYSPY